DRAVQARTVPKAAAAVGGFAQVAGTRRRAPPGHGREMVCGAHSRGRAPAACQRLIEYTYAATSRTCSSVIWVPPRGSIGAGNCTGFGTPVLITSAISS